jgi:phosphatidylserine/phosphatidylglycerophosphate/cardiolipin synthase-like enzyme
MGVALVTLGSVSSTVNMTLRGTNGVTVSSSTVPLTPSQQTAKFVSELFPGATNFEGTLELTAARSIAAIALRQHFSGIFSTVPVSPTPKEVLFSPNAGTSARIVQEINQAQSTIDIAIYSFTRDEIADALIVAKNPGITISHPGRSQ